MSFRSPIKVYQSGHVPERNNASRTQGRHQVANLQLRLGIQVFPFVEDDEFAKSLAKISRTKCRVKLG